MQTVRELAAMATAPTTSLRPWLVSLLILTVFLLASTGHAASYQPALKAKASIAIRGSRPKPVPSQDNSLSQHSNTIRSLKSRTDVDVQANSFMKAERDAMMQFAIATNYKNWTKNDGWGDEGYVCDGRDTSWYGVTCYGSHVSPRVCRCVFCCDFVQ